MKHLENARLKNIQKKIIVMTKEARRAIMAESLGEALNILLDIDKILKP